MKKKIIPHLIVCVVLLIVFSPLLIYNCQNNTEFFKAPLTSIISAFFVVYVSFYLAQWKNDTREKIKHVESLVFEIKGIINSDDFYLVETESQRRVALIRQRKIANKIAILEEYDLTGKSKENVKKIKEEYKALREFLGEHFNDSEYMKKSENEIARRISKIDNLCDKICVCLRK